MLKSCRKCGKIHDSSFICNNFPVLKKKKTEAQSFRSSYAWLKKQREIRRRDKNLCRICLLNLYDTKIVINYNDLSVHHIIPIAEDYTRRLDDHNLISLCYQHHRLAESGVIPKDVLLQEAKHPPTFDGIKI